MDMNDENYKHREIKIMIDDLTEQDYCYECDEKRCYVICNKCANSVCTSATCSTLFPHRKNTMFVVCRKCRFQIESQFKLVVDEIDYDKLVLLKRKIKRNLQKRRIKQRC